MEDSCIIRGALHAIYFRLNSAFLKNDRETANKYLSIMETELSLDQSALSKELTKPHLDRFKKIQERIKSNEYGRIYNNGTSSPKLEDTKKVEKSGNELAFCRSLVENKYKLYEKLNINRTANIDFEVDLGEYGRADIIIKDGRKLYIVETKMGTSPTSLVSQIDKYIVAFELKMNYGLFDYVIPIVLAESFSEYVNAELSRMGVTMMLHNGNVDSLRKIDEKVSLIFEKGIKTDEFTNWP